MGSPTLLSSIYNLDFLYYNTFNSTLKGYFFMLRTAFISILLSTFLFSSSNFTVRLAVYGNEARLQKVIDRLPPALRKTVTTYNRGDLTYAQSIPTTDEATLKKLLPAYQKVFSDAYIAPTKRK